MKKNFEKLTKEELVELRNDIVLNSHYLADYENSFGFNAVQVSYFFGGYVDYIFEFAEEDGVTDFSCVFDAYDTEENLWSWFNCYDDLSWITFNNGMRIGDKVKWNDPAIDDFDPEEIEIQRKRVYTLIEVINDEICLISDDFGDSEVYFDELEKIGE